MEKRREGERNREKNGLRFIGSLRRWLHWPKLSCPDQAGIRSLSLVSHMSVWSQGLGPYSYCPKPLAETWKRCGAAVAWTWAHMDHCVLRVENWSIEPLWHSRLFYDHVYYIMSGSSWRGLHLISFMGCSFNRLRCIYWGNKQHSAHFFFF